MRIANTRTLSQEEQDLIKLKEEQINAVLGDDYTLVYTEVITRPGNIVKSYDISVVKLLKDTDNGSN